MVKGTSAREWRRLMQQALDRHEDRGSGAWIYRKHMMFVWGDTAAAKSFAELFRSVWNRIPIKARWAILRLWKQEGKGPRINLSDEPSEGGAWGTVNDDGFRLCFCQKAFERFGSEIMGPIIAHELAHVYQYATGWSLIRVPGEEGPVHQHESGLIFREPEFEWNVSCEILPEWGFDDLVIYEKSEEIAWKESIENFLAYEERKRARARERYAKRKAEKAAGLLK